METWIGVAQQLSNLTFATLLVIILIGSWLEVWVWGRQYREVKAEKEEWKAAALTGTGLAVKATNTAEALARRRSEQDR